MGLVNAATMLGYMNTFRVCHLAGRYGGGKSALAFRIAYECVRRGFSRYILSNVKSVWVDDPESVVLREGLFVDAVVILDEGGLFLKSGYDADKFLAFLRKLNIILLVPSVMPPATKMRFLTIQRVFNAQTLGFPMWVYRLDLSYANSREKDFFMWFRPQEIYGVYDTLGFPSDDGGLSRYVDRWTASAMQGMGYERQIQSSAVITYEGQENNGIARIGETSSGGVAVLDELRRVSQSIEEGAAETSQLVSVLYEKGRKGRRN